MASDGRDRVEPDGQPTEGITLQVWSDLVCPWCYVTKHRIRAAVEGWVRPSRVRVHHRCFELDPHRAPGTSVPVILDLARRYRIGLPQARTKCERVTEAAAEAGLVLDFESAVTANTFDAHRLVSLARQLGGLELAQAALERFYVAHFAEGLALDGRQVLHRISAEAGLDEGWVAAVLKGDDYAEQVRDDEAEAALRGVTVVPYVVANDRQPLVGAQPTAMYGHMLDAVWS